MHALSRFALSLVPLCLGLLTLPTPAEAGTNGALPDIAVSGNTINITDGAITPNTADGTDFGPVLKTGGSAAQSFVISNVGNAPLTVSGAVISGPHAADFVLSAFMGATVNPGTSTTIQVTFNPSAIGTRVATLTITSDDADEGTFDFSLTGVGSLATSTTTLLGNSTPVTIPDGPAAVTSTIEVSGAGTFLYDINLRTFIQHTFSADLDVTITSPSGTVVTLTTDNGAGNDNVFNGTIWDDSANPGGQVPYTTNNGLVTDQAYTNLVVAPTLVPEEALAAFIGENPNGTWTITVSDDLAGDGGSLDAWSIDLTTLAKAPTITEASEFTNTTPVTIPTGPAVVTSTIDVSGLGTTLQDVNIQTFIRHTFASDLDITITSPSGTVVTLTTDNGAGNDDVFNGTTWDDSANPGGQVPYTTNNGVTTDNAYANLTVASSLTPEEALGAFIGEDPNGTWTITISDDLAGDGGNLDSWSLILRTATFESTNLGVSGKNIAIASGDTTPDTTDDTDYGNVVANVGSVTRTFTVSNTGTLALNLTGTSPVTLSGSSDFSVTAQPSSPVAVLTGTTTFDVKFTPTSLGAQTATVSIASDDASHPTYTFDVKGTGIGLPKLKVSDNGGMTYLASETRETLGEVRVHTTGSPKSFQLTNGGNAVLNVGELTIDGTNASDFQVSGLSTPSATSVGGAHVMGTTVSTVVNPGDIFEFTVTFSPSSVGSRTATLHIPSDDPDVADFTLNLTGTGTAPAILVIDDDADQFRANNDTEDLGSVVFGKSSSPRHMRISNKKGTASLIVDKMTISGTNYSDFAITQLVLDQRAGTVPSGAVVQNNQGFEIKAGESANFTITFTPSALGTRTALLHIPSNDLTTPLYAIKLTGNGQQLDPPTVSLPKTQPVLNKPTGLFEWLLIVRNPNANAITGFDLYISDLPSTVTVWNAATDLLPASLPGSVGTKDAPKPKSPIYRLHYGAPLSAGASTTVVVLFASKKRPMPKLNPSIRLQIVESDIPSKGLYGVPVLKVTKVPGKGNQVEFASTIGGNYRIWYTANVRNTSVTPVPTGPWYSVPALIKGTGTKTLWMDQGPPCTIISPLEDPKREYRVELVLPYRPIGP